MTETDSWSVFGDTVSAPKSSASSPRLEPLAEEYDKLTKERDAIGERIGQLENEIAHLFPEEAGELAKHTGKFEVVVTRSERWVWNKEALEALFGSGNLPDHVKRSLTVDKRKFQRLPKHEQEPLRPALTRKLDKPKIKVIPHV